MATTIMMKKIMVMKKKKMRMMMTFSKKMCSINKMHLEFQSMPSLQKLQERQWLTIMEIKALVYSVLHSRCNRISKVMESMKVLLKKPTKKEFQCLS